MTASVLVALRVNASPQAAFDAFTQEIGLWWRPNQLFQLTPRGDGVLSFDGHARLITTFANGKVFEIGRVTAWEAPHRLAFTWRQASFAEGMITRVDVLFEAVGEETRISVTHGGWDSVPQEHVARHGFPLRLFQLRQGEHWRALLAEMARRML